MDKFWKIKNQTTENPVAEILLYGEISSETWFGDEVTPKMFAADLTGLNDSDVKVRINSPGGDVFAAHAIYNLLKSYKGKVTCYVDGLAASAATVVAMAGDMVVMPKNALFMIHNPATFCSGMVGVEDLEKMKNALDAVKTSIIAAYLDKCKDLDEKKLSKLMDAETWMTADEAKELGFCDVIEGDDLDIALDGNYLMVNSLKCDVSKFKNFRNKFAARKEEKEMSLIEQFINELKGFKEAPAEAENKVDKADIIAEERKRVADLQALDNGNAFVAAVVKAAIDKGDSVEAVKGYVDALKAVNVAEAAPHAQQVKDVAESGAEKVNAEPMSNDDIQKTIDQKAMEQFVNFMKK